MSTRDQYPTYHKAVQAFLNHNTLLFHRCSKSSLLSQVEKKLLKMRMLKRHQKYDEVLQVSRQISQLGNSFFSAEKNFLLASTFFLKGNIKESLRYNLLAHEQYGLLQDRRGLFLTSYNLSVDLGKLGNFVESSHWLVKSKFFANHPSEQVLTIRAQICEFSKQGDFSQMMPLLLELESHLHELSSMDQNISQSVLADIYCRLGEFQKAFFYLSRLIKMRKIEEKPKIFFQYYVLQAFLAQKTLGYTHKAILLSQEYTLKWKVLSHFQAGQSKEADLALSYLKALLPTLINKDYSPCNPADRNDIFFRFLSVLMTPKVSRTFEQTPQVSDDLPRRLVQILSTKRYHRIDRTELISAIWEKPYCPSFDARFYKLIERTRIKFPHIKIKSLHRAYSIE